MMKYLLAPTLCDERSAGFHYILGAAGYTRFKHLLRIRATRPGVLVIRFTATHEFLLNHADIMNVI
jgi:hypothetical protein